MNPLRDECASLRCRKFALGRFDETRGADGVTRNPGRLRPRLSVQRIEARELGVELRAGIFVEQRQRAL
jgi:hypothetical protein